MASKRYDGNANNGLIEWPLGRTHNSGEGGMTVYAIWPERYGEHAAPGWSEEGVFYNCFPGFHVKANIAESPVSDLNPIMDRLLYAVLCLGTSGGSWVLDDGEFWEATAADLNPAGLELVSALNVLYGVEATLVTVVDT